VQSAREGALCRASTHTPRPRQPRKRPSATVRHVFDARRGISSRSAATAPLHAREHTVRTQSEHRMFSQSTVPLWRPAGENTLSSAELPIMSGTLSFAERGSAAARRAAPLCASERSPIWSAKNLTAIGLGFAFRRGRQSEKSAYFGRGREAARFMIGFVRPVRL